jgi:hypothetical protein
MFKIFVKIGQSSDLIVFKNLFNLLISPTSRKKFFPFKIFFIFPFYIFKFNNSISIKPFNSDYVAILFFYNGKSIKNSNIYLQSALFTYFNYSILDIIWRESFDIPLGNLNY